MPRRNVIPAVRWAEEASPASLESTAGRSGLTHSRLCGSHRNGAARRPRILDAAGGDQYARDIVLVWAASAHRRRSS